MNKYINNLTVKEYEEILQFLRELEPIEKQKMEKTKETKSYVELRFLIIKIKKIIDRYKKGV